MRVLLAKSAMSIGVGCVVMLAACDRKQLPDGHIAYFYEDGTKQAECTIIDGELDGQWRWWHADGTLAEEGTFDAGRAEGVWKYWHENGHLKAEGHYCDDLAVGKWAYYFENGQIFLMGGYDRSGERTNMWQWWNPNGKLAKQCEYSSGGAVGDVMLWHVDGVACDHVIACQPQYPFWIAACRRDQSLWDHGYYRGNRSLATL